MFLSQSQAKLRFDQIYNFLSYCGGSLVYRNVIKNVELKKFAVSYFLRFFQILLTTVSINMLLIYVAQRSNQCVNIK